MNDREININIEHVTRVEGHGNIIMDLSDGKIKKIEWQVSEAPRFFEAFLRGVRYSEMHLITSRICGICSKAHTLASLRAVEDALDVKISEQTRFLRKIIMNAEMIQSHILHVGYLVVPDLYGVTSLLSMPVREMATTKKIVRLHRLSNEISETLCGRAVHPLGLKVGGFYRLPDTKKLESVKAILEESLEVALKIAKTLDRVQENFPELERETEYIGLVNDGEYPFYEGLIGSTDTGNHQPSEYEEIMKERIVPRSTAKHTSHSRNSYMVGALARFNLNHKELRPKAMQVAKEMELSAPCCKPFMNSIAQMVELVHCIETSLEAVDKLLEDGIKEESVEVVPKAGRGIGIVEAPRGILIHDFTFDEKGNCIKANCVIPTNQNHASIQQDMENFAPALIDRPKEEIALSLEMLVRAYDPCISCSTHYLNVEFE